MNKLTKLIAPALAASLALGAAVPASAATFVHSAGNVRVELAQLDQQIDVARARHQISASESATLQKKVDRVQNLYRTYSRNGFSRSELRVLDNQIDTVKRDLARQANDRDNFGHNGRGYGHRR